MVLRLLSNFPLIRCSTAYWWHCLTALLCNFFILYRLHIFKINLHVNIIKLLNILLIIIVLPLNVQRFFVDGDLLIIDCTCLKCTSCRPTDICHTDRTTSGVRMSRKFQFPNSVLSRKIGKCLWINVIITCLCELRLPVLCECFCRHYFFRFLIARFIVTIEYCFLHCLIYSYRCGGYNYYFCQANS